MIIAANEICNLRNLEKDDLHLLTSYANNPKIAINLRNGFPNPYTSENAFFFYNMIEAQNPKTFFAIEHQNNFCGMISLAQLSDVYCKTAEIGYWLAEPYWNQGIMTSAVKLIVEWGWKNMDIIRIHTGVYSYNPSSAKVLEKAGFTFECEFINSIYKNGILANELRYSILKSTK
jgi:[ribosomal protein S5]-alanine N-acetyltransferase